MCGARRICSIRIIGCIHAEALDIALMIKILLLNNYILRNSVSLNVYIETQNKCFKIKIIFFLDRFIYMPVLLNLI